MSTQPMEPLFDPEDFPKIQPSHRRRRWLRGLLFLALLGVLLVLVAPPLIAHTFLRNLVIGRAFPDPEIQAHSSGATFGWLSPLRIEQLAIRHLQRGDVVQIDQVTSGRTLLGLIWQKSELGSFTIERPTIELIASKAGLPERPDEPPDPDRVRPTFSAHVYGAHLTLRTIPAEPPIIDVRDVNLLIDVQRTAQGRVLVADDVKIFQHAELTDDMCHRGLQLVAPLLANAATVDGEISLRLNKLRVPLDADDPELRSQLTEVDGNLELHRVSTGIRNPIVQRVAEVLTGILRLEMPQQIRIADNSDVHFYTQDGRVFHEGFAFGLPEISPDLQIRTSGSVGLDESLDLLVEVPIPLTLLHDGPILRRLSERPLELKVAGFLNAPLITLPDDREWHEELLGRLLETPPENLEDATAAEAVIDVVGALMDARRERLGAGEPSVLDRVRTWRRRRREPQTDEPARETPLPDAPPPETPPASERRGREF